MFNRLVIKNFQRHKKLEIDFNGRITTIVGPTDSGKSAIIRAVRWVCTNQPNGLSGILRDGAKSVRVELHFGKHKVVRERSKSKNLYWLNDQKFNAFGNKVPDPITSALKLVDLNFQFQLDPVFWFSQNAGQVSKELNKIVNLDDIDKALTFSKSLVTKAKWRHDLLLEDKAESLKAVNEWAWTKEADVDLKEIEDLARQRNLLRKEMEGLDSCWFALSEAGDIVWKASQLGDAYKQIATIAEQCVTAEATVSGLGKVIKTWKLWEDRVCQAHSQLSSLKKSAKEKNSICPTCGRPLGP